MNMMIAAVVVLAVLLTPGPRGVMAQEASVFGLKMGQPLQAHSCADSRLPPSQGFCEGEREILDTVHRVKLRFASGELPAWVAPGITTPVEATLVGGRLAMLRIPTLGVNVALLIEDALVKKFGEPTRRVSAEAQNGLGRKVAYEILGWDLDGLTVAYLPVLGRLDEGQLNIATPLGMGEYQKQQQKLRDVRAGKRPL